MALTVPLKRTAPSSSNAPTAPSTARQRADRTTPVLIRDISPPVGVKTGAYSGLPQRDVIAGTGGCDLSHASIRGSKRRLKGCLAVRRKPHVDSGRTRGRGKRYPETPDPLMGTDCGRCEARA